jgi:hypothetical protein
MSSVVLSADRREAFQREELRDVCGVATGVVAGVLVWLVFLSLMRLLV